MTSNNNLVLLHLFSQHKCLSYLKTYQSIHKLQTCHRIIKIPARKLSYSLYSVLYCITMRE